ncbi:MAG TPA: excinuclease ABC subunit UvrA [Phycisphaerae bacterium]|nr:excinuclease ABC subunit UvrA [Phycisphaerae bacterium]
MPKETGHTASHLARKPPQAVQAEDAASAPANGDEFILIQGARQHNLKNIDVRVPRDKLVVITGLSGSGKSSLAFDTIYAEGQRRYVESLSAYARQFLEQMEKPDVDAIEGLPPTIAIHQRRGGFSPRSTVATATEIHDYLRLLFARVGTAYCPKCGREIRPQRAEQIVESVLSLERGARLIVLAPIVRGQRGEHRDILRSIVADGFVRVRIDKRMYEVRDVPDLAKTRRHTIDVVVDRLVAKEAARSRLSDSVEQALRMSDGLVVVCHEAGPGNWKNVLYSERYACTKCNVSLEELTPRLFSFNSPYGACPHCHGLGTYLAFDDDLVVPDADRSLAQGAVAPWRDGPRRYRSFYSEALARFVRDFGVDETVPFRKLPKRTREVLLHGGTLRRAKGTAAAPDAEWEGVVPSLRQMAETTRSAYAKRWLQEFMTGQPCPECNGARLRPEARAVHVSGKPIHEITAMSIDEAAAFFESLQLKGEKQTIARQVLAEIRARLKFMQDVGIAYLTLDRSSDSLSGGEAQRIRLATQVGSGLVGVCYVLDEPTIGLHARDNRRLLGTLVRLRDLGNTVLVVEHDEDTIRTADHVLDMGPGAGEHGGEVVAQGTLDEITASPASLTGKYLAGATTIPVPAERRRVRKRRSIRILGAQENNLQGLNITVPLGCLVCVTGVSGSGKSTLVAQTLVPALRRKLYGSRVKPGAHRRLTGADQIDRVIEIDQSPIGRTPRSNAATYTKVFDQIRRVFAQTREAKVRGYGPGRFSFNVKGGRCEVCQGQGVRKVEMHFLPDVYVTCRECNGTRFGRETLEIAYRAKTIADVLEMRVSEALRFFENFPRIVEQLGTLDAVGLGYITLGQNSTTLSGGEAQRVKLSAELGKRSTGRTIYVLDEPTTGLHFADIQRLLDVLARLVDMGNTVLVVEHNFEVIKSADWIIDLGPEGGDAGGRIVAEGTPEQVAAIPASYTGQYLARHLA